MFVYNKLKIKNIILPSNYNIKKRNGVIFLNFESKFDLRMLKIQKFKKLFNMYSRSSTYLLSTTGCFIVLLLILYLKLKNLHSSAKDLQSNL